MWSGEVGGADEECGWQEEITVADVTGSHAKRSEALALLCREGLAYVVFVAGDCG